VTNYTIPYGKKALLSWTYKNGAPESQTINGENVTGKTSLEVMPSKREQYTLTGVDGKVDTKQLDVAVRGVEIFAGDPIGGYFDVDNYGTKALTGSPEAIALADDNTLYIADDFNIRKLTIATKKLETISNLTNGVNWHTNGSLIYKNSILYVNDAQANDTFISKLNTNTKLLEPVVDLTLLGYGTYIVKLFCMASATKFYATIYDSANTSISIAEIENNILTVLYSEIADSNSKLLGISGFKYSLLNNCLFLSSGSSNSIYKFSLLDNTLTLLAGKDDNLQPGSAEDGIGILAGFNGPRGLAVYNTTLYVADRINQKIRHINITTGEVTTIAGSGTMGYLDGAAATAQFHDPFELEIDSTGTKLFISDENNNSIRQLDLTTNTVSTLCGKPVTLGYTDGTGSVAKFNGCTLGNFENDGSILIGDQANRTVRKITSSGVVTTLAGNPLDTTYIETDGDALTQAIFMSPTYATTDTDGSILITDTSSLKLRKLFNNIVSTVTLTNAGSYYTQPTAPIITYGGYRYVASYHSIWKVDSNWNATIFAGNVLSNGVGTDGNTDGIGELARFRTIIDMCLGPDNNLYIVEQGNPTIRKINITTAEVTTLAGTPSTPGDVDGPALSAQFSGLVSIAIDSTGTIYVADSSVSKIKKLANGIVSTVTGGHTASFEGPLSDDAQTLNTYAGTIVSPLSVRCNRTTGDLYVSNIAGIFIITNP
jgi:hypothetical protein